MPWLRWKCLAAMPVVLLATAGFAAERPIMEPSLVEQAISAAKELESRQLIYNSTPEKRRDCSGIFHRLLDMLEPRCQGLERPDIRSFRSSRAIADWYLQQGRLRLVDDALEKDRWIEPGVILFYGRLGKTYESVDEEIVTTQTQHLGLVTSVTRDDDGNVLSYELFHGRSGRKPAAITDYHVRHPRRSSYPPLGNGQQQWIAVAQFCDGNCRCLR